MTYRELLSRLLPTIDLDDEAVLKIIKRDKTDCHTVWVKRNIPMAVIGGVIYVEASDIDAAKAEL